MDIFRVKPDWPVVLQSILDKPQQTAGTILVECSNNGVKCKLISLKTVYGTGTQMQHLPTSLLHLHGDGSSGMWHCDVSTALVAGAFAINAITNYSTFNNDLLWVSITGRLYRLRSQTEIRNTNALLEKHTDNINILQAFTSDSNSLHWCLCRLSGCRQP